MPCIVLLQMLAPCSASRHHKVSAASLGDTVQQTVCHARGLVQHKRSQAHFLVGAGLPQRQDSGSSKAVHQPADCGLVAGAYRFPFCELLWVGSARGPHPIFRVGLLLSCPISTIPKHRKLNPRSRGGVSV